MPTGMCKYDLKVVVGVERKAVVGTQSQISALTEGFYTEMGFRIHPLKNLIRGVLSLEGIGGILILYKGYIEANLTIPDLPWYNKDILFLVVFQIINMEIESQCK